jgi:hypothetical protein
VVNSGSVEQPSREEAEVVHDSTTADDKRTARGLGPFTGRQLTVIIVTAVLVVGLPVGAYASIRGSNVFVTDHISGAHASVSSTGSLQTTAVAPIGGVAVHASVSAGSLNCGFFSPPAGKAFEITGVVLVPAGASTSSGTALTLDAESHTGCAGPLNDIAFGTYSADQPDHFSFNPGIGLKSGHYLDFYAIGSPGTSRVLVYGYYISATACSVNCL